jgi:hypothetical protein
MAPALAASGDGADLIIDGGPVISGNALGCGKALKI